MTDRSRVPCRASLSNHAREELVRRGIGPEEMEAVLAAPGQIVEEHGGIVCYQSRIIHSGKPYLLRVMVTDALDPKGAVTVYKTSKLNKCWQP